VVDGFPASCSLSVFEAVLIAFNLADRLREPRLGALIGCSFSDGVPWLSERDPLSEESGCAKSSNGVLKFIALLF
jgi:hypothetical protein